VTSANASFACVAQGRAMFIFDTCSLDAAAAVSLASGLLGKDGKEGKEGNDALDIVPRVLPCSVSAASAASELPPMPAHSFPGGMGMGL